MPVSGFVADRLPGRQGLFLGSDGREGLNKEGAARACRNLSRVYEISRVPASYSILSDRLRLWLAGRLDPGPS